jgi:hypothetical protein
MKTSRLKKIESLKGVINPTEQVCYFRILGSDQWYLKGKPINEADIPADAAKMVVQDKEDMQSFESYIYENQ